MAITTKIEFIDKERAKELLAMNKNNFRKIRNRIVEQYAREMEKGDWKFNGEAIQIYEDGTLANGQHRLAAIVKSGCTCKMLVVYGVPKDITTFDVGSKRSLQQIASARGIKISSHEAGAAGIIMLGLNSDRAGRYGVDELLEFYETIPYLDDINKAFTRHSDHPILRKGPCMAAALCCVLLDRISMEQIGKFAKICNSGIPIENTASNAPICLRNTLAKGFKHHDGMNVQGGYTERVKTFDVTYSALCDFAKNKQPVRLYKPKRESAELNDIIANAQIAIQKHELMTELNL